MTITKQQQQQQSKTQRKKKRNANENETKTHPDYGSCCMSTRIQVFKQSSIRIPPSECRNMRAYGNPYKS